jgi:hypothetical protein
MSMVAVMVSMMVAMVMVVRPIRAKGAKGSKWPEGSIRIVTVVVRKHIKYS